MLGLSGTVLLCAAEATAGASSGPGARSAGSTVLGVVLGLTAGLTYAVYSWAAHRLIGRGLTSGAAMGTVFGIGGLLLVPVLAATGAPLLDSWSAAAVGAYMALVPMFLGYVLFGWGLARVRASTATTLTLLEPAVAAVLAVLVVGERLRPMRLGGCRSDRLLPRRAHRAVPRRGRSPGRDDPSAPSPGRGGECGRVRAPPRSGRGTRARGRALRP